MIQIGPALVRVVIDHDETEAHDLNGGYVHRQQRILLSPHLAPDFMRMVLLEEVLHGILRIGSLYQGLTADLEEQLVQGLSAHLLDLLRRNPELVEWLRQ